MFDKRVRFFSSVQAKVILITITTVTLVLGVYAFLEFNHKRIQLDQEVRELADNTTNRLANNLRIPVWDIDTELVDNSVNAEMRDRNISVIIVNEYQKSDGTTPFLLGKKRDALGNVVAVKSDEDLQLQDNEFLQSMDIEYQSEKIGTVSVYVTKELKLQQLQKSVVGLVVALLVFDVIIFLVLWLVMRQILVKPIAHLSEAAGQISRGKFSVPIDIDRNDEIGIVAHSIDRMKVSLRLAMEKLHRIDQQKKAAIARRRKKSPS